VGHNHTWLRLVDIRGYTNVLYDMSDEEPRLGRLLEMLEGFNMGLLDNWIERVGVEWMDFAEDLGMQSGPMLAPEHFRRYIKPSYRRLFRRAREGGCLVHVHADGDLRSLVDDLLECAPDIINLQDLVNGVDWIRERLAGRLCIELDIDRQKVTFGGSPAEIDALIRSEVEALGRREGGLMMIYGLYPGVPLENVKAVMDAMERYAGHLS
jgi:uroporphyrinogen decarboxylase